MDTEYVEKFNEGLLEYATGARPADKGAYKQYLNKGDFSKFNDLNSFLRSLVYIFASNPEQMHEYIKKELLPIYLNSIKPLRDEILSSDVVASEVEKLKDMPLRFKVYMDMKLAGKLNLEYVKKIFMDESGMNLRVYFKVKKGQPPIADRVCMELFALSKLRQNAHLSRMTLYGYCLDFDEFLMFICLLILYMKNHGLGSKS